MDRSSRHRVWKLERLLSKAEKLLPAVLTKREESKVSLEASIQDYPPHNSMARDRGCSDRIIW